MSEFELQRLYEAQLTAQVADERLSVHDRNAAAAVLAASRRLRGAGLRPADGPRTWVFSDPHFEHEASVAIFGRPFRTEADWLRDLDRELPFPRNVEAEGVQLHPVHRPARRPPGDLPPVTRKGVRHAVPVWLKEARSDLKVLGHHLEWLKGGRFHDPGMAARPAFDAVFFSAMAWCLTKGVSVVRRRDLPASVERHLIEPGVLAPGWRDRIRTLWEAWKAEVDWNPDRDAEPTIDDAAGWAETARGFCGLARDAIAADGIDVDPSEEAGTGGSAADAAAVP